jgi:hypothetical protein
MPRPPVVVHPAATVDEIELERLEQMVIAGQRALLARNALIVDAYNRKALTKAGIYHRLNSARVSVGAEPLTRSAVDVIIRRERAERLAAEWLDSRR